MTGILVAAVLLLTLAAFGDIRLAWWWLPILIGATIGVLIVDRRRQ